MDGADADVPKKTSSIMSQVAGSQVAGRRVAGRRSQGAGMTVTVPGFPSSPSTVIRTGRKA